MPLTCNHMCELFATLQVCVGKEREERVMQELRVTELEEEMETQLKRVHSAKYAVLVHVDNAELYSLHSPY